VVGTAGPLPVAEAAAGVGGGGSGLLEGEGEGKGEIEGDGLLSGEGRQLGNGVGEGVGPGVAGGLAGGDSTGSGETGWAAGAPGLERSTESALGEALGGSEETAGAQLTSAVTGRPMGFIRVRTRAIRISAISASGATTVEAGRSRNALIVL
jgi:hypothetical protein